MYISDEAAFLQPQKQKVQRDCLFLRNVGLFVTIF